MFLIGPRIAQRLVVQPRVNRERRRFLPQRQIQRKHAGMEQVLRGSHTRARARAHTQNRATTARRDQTAPHRRPPRVGPPAPPPVTAIFSAPAGPKITH